jgi:DNA invertase Pin-like site-specific DNA recombinase
MLLSYARVSTEGQDHALQLDALRTAGCERVFVEVASGSRTDRAELAKLLEQARAGTRWSAGALIGSDGPCGT